MKNIAVEYYNNGYNCSQCILKAFELKYKFPISEESYKMCTGISTGLGVGTTCSGLVAGIMIFGILFDEEKAKSLRMKLLAMFSEEHRSINCDSLIRERDADGTCEKLVLEIAGMIESIIIDEDIL